MVDFGHGVIEPEICTAAARGIIQEFHIEQHGPEEFTVWMKIASPTEVLDMHWVPRRDRTQPRQFKNLQRLIHMISAKFPQVKDIHLHLQSQVGS